MLASGHESGEGDLVTANGQGDLPGEQGNASAVDATGHVESGLGETGIDPRIATCLPESESERDRSEDRDRSREDSNRDEARLRRSRLQAVSRARTTGPVTRAG